MPHANEDVIGLPELLEGVDAHLLDLDPSVPEPCLQRATRVGRSQLLRENSEPGACACLQRLCDDPYSLDEDQSLSLALLPNAQSRDQRASALAQAHATCHLWG